jgi:hypothetical protein
MVQCWDQDPQERPDMLDVICDLQILLESLPADDRTEVDRLDIDGGDELDRLCRK